MEKLKGKKCSIISVGFYPGNALQALAKTLPIDVVFLVNSEPKNERAMRAMEDIHKFINEFSSKVGSEVTTIDLWLDPKDGIVNAVARLRSTIEEYAPCSITIGMAGGLRWLSATLMFLALTLSSVGKYVGVTVDYVYTMLEEESRSIRTLFRTIEERTIPWPTIPKLVDLTFDEYNVLKLIGLGKHRAKDIHSELNKNCKRPSGCISMATIQRILVKLVKKGLISYEKRGKAHYYDLKPLGTMIIGKLKTT